MKRLELFEFEDFHWLPNLIRSGITKLIKVFHRMIGTSDVLVDLILNVMQKINFTQIVDLGSGAGGPMIETIEKINQSNTIDHPISLLLTDKYPSPETIEHVNNLKSSHISYRTESLDALNIDQSPKGLKTMIASFHHMQPAIAKQILDSAENSQEPILIYEIAENNIPILLWCLLLPISLLVLIIMSLVMTPFVKPLTLKQLVFTYIIPIIPIIYAWDGQASIMRTYTFNDIESLIGNRDHKNYHWEIEKAKKSNGKNAGYYILGYPS